MLSPDKQSHWINLIVNEVINKGLVECSSQIQITRSTRRAMTQFITEHNQIEEKVRKKIASLKRTITENSAEWEVLFSTYYKEELSRSHLAER